MNGSPKYYRPMYYGVDWVDDASCCQLCNGGDWGSNSLLRTPCKIDTVPQLLCNNKRKGDNTMLRHEVKAEE
eukprot:5053682-Ditylum_brightwellii.AAC.1